MHLYIKYFVINLLLILLIGCNAKQPETKDVADLKPELKAAEKTEKKPSMKTILCFGNSLTAGYGLDDESTAWPSLLQERLDSLDISYEVVNAGLSGETTSGGLNRIEWVLSQPVDLFFLELGANDMLRGLDVSATKENLTRLLDKVKAKYPDIPIVIAGMLSPPNMGPAYEASFNKIFPDLASKYNATLIPFFLNGVAGDASLNLPDGKHPNVAGQKIVLETVWDKLENLL